MEATTSPASAVARATHAVTNQVPPLEGTNLFTDNAPLAEGLEAAGAGWARERLESFGELTARAETLLAGRLANENPPVLRTHDRYGNRIDEVEYHPAYHELMAISIGWGAHSAPWSDPRPGAHVARAAGSLCMGQVEAGHGCPVSMTYSAVPALRVTPTLAAEWEPRLLSTEYDPRLVPPGGKRSALCGMAMTEKQGGSDVRAGTTRAEPVNGGGPGGEYTLTGHKWFCSAPMCDVFLTLAQAPEGLSCFVLPRVLPDGSRNEGFRLQRLKDKLGNRSNASSEVEYDGALAWMLGEPGRGVPTIIEMVSHTRLDCVLGSAAGMRAAVAQATHHAEHRSAFGSTLAEKPLMTAVLADLCLESEAATLLSLRLARAFDEAAADPRAADFKRIATPVSKYWVCKRYGPLAAEALECLGGNGYVEESGMPRLLRESPLNSLWEGSGNVICLDVLRAIARAPHLVEVLLDEVDEAATAEPRLARYSARVRDGFRDPEGIEGRARRLVEGLALALSGSLVVRHSPPAVADAFCATRLDGDWGHAFGTLPAGVDARGIVARHRPSL